MRGNVKSGAPGLPLIWVDEVLGAFGIVAGFEIE
jgi:hypothetical protein